MSGWGCDRRTLESWMVSDVTTAKSCDTTFTLCLGLSLWIPCTWENIRLGFHRKQHVSTQLYPKPFSETGAAEAPTLEVWLVTISAATQVLTSSALLKSCNRYLSCT